MKKISTIYFLLTFVLVKSLISQGLVNNGASIRIMHGTSFVISGAAAGDLTNTDGTIANYGDLYIESDLINNDTLINGSDESGDGKILISGSVSGSGTSISERYYYEQSNDGSKPSGRWWYITPSVSNVTSDDFLALDYPRMWIYDESIPAWSQITSSTALSPLQGFATKVGSDQSIQFVGDDFYDGTLNFSLTNTNDGWNLIGNPYPATVDIDAVMVRNAALVNESIWIRTNRSYATWNSTSKIGTNQGTQYVSTMQAFWVLCESPGSFQFQDVDKSVDESSLLKSVQRFVWPTLRLEVSNNEYSDEVVFAVRDGAGSGFESFDTKKRFGSSPAELYFELENGEKLVANVIGELPDTSVYPIGIQVAEAGEYVFRNTELRDFGDEMEIYLDDLDEGNSVLLGKDVSYTFSSEEVTSTDRFQLRFYTIPSLVGNDEQNRLPDPRIYAHQDQVFLQTGSLGTEQIFIKIYDLYGRVVRSGLFEGSSKYSISMSEQTGVFIVQMSGNGRSYSEKIVISF